jgi:N-acetylneuraminate synthase
LNLVPFSTPFDETAVDFLEDLGVPLYKIASLEIVDIPLIAYVASTGKPLIISTGTASLGEIEEAVNAAREAGCKNLTLLICSSSYPANAEDVNLSRLPFLANLFDVRVGYSDHTLGIGVSLAAVALGASVIEKHLTLDKSHGGVDSAFSADPPELKNLIEGTRSVAKSLGRPSAWFTKAESESLRLRPSLYVSADVSQGDRLTHQNVRSVRPSGGLEPKNLPQVLGMKFKAPARAGTPLSWSIIEDI